MPIPAEIIGCCYLAILYLNLVARSLICLVFTETIILDILGFIQGVIRIMILPHWYWICSHRSPVVRQPTSRETKHRCLFDGLPGGHVLGNIS